MSDRQLREQAVYANWKSQSMSDISPGIRAVDLWQGEERGKAIVVKIQPGGKWQGVDIHETSSEEIFVASGVFNDGDRNYEAGTFIHYPLGSSHVPQSATGCVLFVFYPD